jgi:hypothetical protein
VHHIADRLREPQLHIYIGITRQRYQGIRVSLQCLSGVMSEGAVLATTVGGCSHHNTKRMYPKARVLYLPGQGQGSLAIFFTGLIKNQDQQFYLSEYLIEHVFAGGQQVHVLGLAAEKWLKQGMGVWTYAE